MSKSYKDFKHIIHGSEDSLDLDVYLLLNEPITDIDCKKLCYEITDSNSNPIYIENGEVKWVYKGTIDEVNNSIYYTYKLHKQEYENPINHLVERDIGLKTLRTIRGLLSNCSRTDYRNIVKPAIRDVNLLNKLEVIKKIDYEKINDYQKTSPVEMLKFFAFQLGSTFPLIMNKKELFSKKDVAREYPFLEEFLYRKSDVNIKKLNDFKNEFCDYLKLQIIQENNSEFVSFKYQEENKYNVKHEEKVESKKIKLKL